MKGRRAAVPDPQWSAPSPIQVLQCGKTLTGAHNCYAAGASFPLAAHQVAEESSPYSSGWRNGAIASTIACV